MAWTAGSLAVVVDAAWRVSLVLMAAWVITRLAGRRPAALRHAIWTAALATALVVPFAAGVMPDWELPLLPAALPATAAAQPPDAAASPHESVPVSQHRAAASEPQTPGLAPPASPMTAAHTAAATGAARESADWIALVWLCVAAALIGRYLASLVSVRYLVRRAEVVDDDRWRDALDVAVAEMGLSRTPALLASEQIAVPFTSGVVRPNIVVPFNALDTWSDDRVRVVLLHELAHIVRRDCLVQAVSQCACAAYWFNPLTWVAVRRLRAERERACDDLVITAGTRGADYAQHLLDIARAATAPASLASAALAMARPSELEGRLLAILDGTRARRRAPTPIWRLAAAASLLVLPIASVQPVARAFTTTDAPAGEVAHQGQPESPPVATPTPSPAPVPTPSPRAMDRRSRTAASVYAASEAVAADITIAALGAAGVLAEAVTDGLVEGVTQNVRQLAQGAPAVAGRKSEARTVSPAVVKGLTEALNDSDPEVRKSAMQALARLRSPIAYDALVAAMKDADAEIREQAAFSLGQLRDARAIDVLATALNDSEGDVRRQAAFALGQLRSDKSIPGLTAALKDSDEEVRSTALFALSQIRSSASVPAFIEAMKDSSAEVRQQAAFALGQAGDERATAVLVAALKDSDEEVRQQAAFALGQIGDESAVDALTAALKDSSADVRRQAVFGLSQIADGHSGRGTERRRRRADDDAPPPPPPPPPAPPAGAPKVVPPAPPPAPPR